MKRLPHVSIGLMLLGFVMTGSAKAAQELLVKTDQTQLLSLSALPGAAIVGNPSIADVTVHGKQIFVHGRAFGETNLIILDVDGNQLAAFDIAVQSGTNNSVQLYKAGARFSYTCAPDCQSTLQAGDEPGYFDGNVKQATGKVELATGKSSSDSATPPAAQ